MNRLSKMPSATLPPNLARMGAAEAPTILVPVPPCRVRQSNGRARNSFSSVSLPVLARTIRPYPRRINSCSGWCILVASGYLHLSRRRRAPALSEVQLSLANRRKI